MRSLITILFFSCFYHNASSQEYHPMAIEGATWVFGYTDENPMWNDVRLHRIEGDTIVNGMTYAQLYQYRVDSETAFTINTKTRRLFGLLRDNTSERKVYGGILDGQQAYFSNFLEEATCNWGEEGGDFQEHVLYDFSLEVGDTLTGCMYIEHPTIASIEMYEEFGLSRRQLRFEDQNYIYQITEQIGNCLGVFRGSEDCYWTGGGYAYNLFNYCVGSFDNCNLLTSINNQIPSDLLEIYPNPATDLISIKSTLELSKLYLSDIWGKVLASYPITTSIDISNNTSGLYILTVIAKDGRRHTEKLVIH